MEVLTTIFAKALLIVLACDGDQNNDARIDLTLGDMIDFGRDIEIRTSALLA